MLALTRFPALALTAGSHPAMPSEPFPPVPLRHRIDLSDDGKLGAAASKQKLTITHDNLCAPTAQARERRIGGCEILGELGRGGMGVVYLGRQERLDRPVALKIVAPAIAGDPEFRERFALEARRAASVRHPHIVPVFDSGEDEGRLYVISAYIDGQDLRAAIARRGGLPPEVAAKITSQIADALAAVHGAGLVHRDVKPANILLDTDGEAYLTDFGLARPAQPDARGLTAAGQWIGTIDYASPEQLQGAPVDRRSDVYSLGCVMYEMLTGSPPFRRNSDMGTATAHLTEHAPRVTSLRPDLPLTWDPIIAGALAKNPAERYQDATSFARAIASASNGVSAGACVTSTASGAYIAGATMASSVPAPAPPPRRPAPRRNVRTPVLVSAAVCLAVVLGVIGGLFALGRFGSGSYHHKSATTLTVAQDTDKLSSELTALAARLKRHPNDPATRRAVRRALVARRAEARSLAVQAHDQSATGDEQERQLALALEHTNRRLTTVVDDLHAVALNPHNQRVQRQLTAAVKKMKSTRKELATAEQQYVAAVNGVPGAPAPPGKSPSHQRSGAGWTQASGSAPPTDGALAAYDASTSHVVLVRPCTDSSGQCTQTGVWTWSGRSWSSTPGDAPSCDSGSQLAPLTLAPGPLSDAGDQPLTITGICDGSLVQSSLSDGTWSPTIAMSGAPALGSDTPLVAADDQGHLLLVQSDDPSNHANPSPATSTWTWDGTTWSEAQPDPAPPPRTDGTLAYDAASGSFLLYDGTAPDGTQPQDTWSWDGVSWTELDSAGGPPPGTYAMTPASGSSPTLLLGTDTDGNWQQWQWKDQQWTRVANTTAPQPGDGALVAAVDPNSGSVVVTAGSPGRTWTSTGTSQAHGG